MPCLPTILGSHDFSTSLCSLVHNSTLSCPQVYAFLSTSLRSLVHKSPLSCPQVSALLSKSLCFLSTSHHSLFHKSPLSYSEVSITMWKVSALLSSSLHSLIHKFPHFCPQFSTLVYSLHCPQVITKFSKNLQYIVHNSPMLDNSGEVMSKFTKGSYRLILITIRETFSVWPSISVFTLW